MSFNAFEALEVTEISGLLDGKASVQLIGVSPDICPEGYTPEYMAVRAARCSYGLGLKDVKTDNGLLLYLLRNGHTSPLEMVKVTLRLTVPLFVAIHFIRHRTARVNMFSQRYATVPETENTYDPLKYDEGIRLASKTNKQGSVGATIDDDAKVAAISLKMRKAEKYSRKIRKLYHGMVADGCAKEIARGYLNTFEYTTLYYDIDLNNLIKFLTLRADFEHAQHETAVIATAIMDLVKPLFPTTMSWLKDRNNGVSLAASEIPLVKSPDLLSHQPERRRVELSRKRKRLALEGLDEGSNSRSKV